ncbi:stearoyl-CoA 9-desaturase, partial [Teladorsagia circumcincta]
MTIATPQSRKPQVDKLISDQFLAAELDEVEKLLKEAFFLHVVGAIGVTAGAHRLWSHRAYKAKLPYRIMLMLMDTTAFQNDIIEWARDHRCHHKWTDTHADPHNTNRGFFFSHMGWLLVKKHPQIKEQGKKLDLSDLFADPVLIKEQGKKLDLSDLFADPVLVFQR